MTRIQQLSHNQAVIALILSHGKSGFRCPSYEQVSQLLNSKGIRTSVGNPWSRKSLFRMLQRQGFSGLHGLFQSS